MQPYHPNIEMVTIFSAGHAIDVFIVSSIYCHLRDHGGILLDAGESTLSQLRRSKYGGEHFIEVFLESDFHSNLIVFRR